MGWALACTGIFMISVPVRKLEYSELVVAFWAAWVFHGFSLVYMCTQQQFEEAAIGGDGSNHLLGIHIRGHLIAAQLCFSNALLTRQVFSVLVQKLVVPIYP